jgi:hypothetical protein
LPEHYQIVAPIVLGDPKAWPEFIVFDVIITATVGGTLLVAMPLIGFSVLETRTVIFLHATIGQLSYSYPARRISAPPQCNGALHLALSFGIGLQLLTAVLPGLRKLLRLEPLTLEILILVSASVLLAWCAAEAYSRIALSTHQAKQRGA